MSKKNNFLFLIIACIGMSKISYSNSLMKPIMDVVSLDTSFVVLDVYGNFSCKADIETIEKWYKLKPEIFNKSPHEF